MIFVCGYIGSGKTTYSKKLAKDKQYELVEVSNIVKEILGEQKRQHLQGHPELDKEIIKRLEQCDDNVVISGARQVSILKAFPNAKLIWLEVPNSERYRRILKRDDAKDEVDSRKKFDEVMKRDIDLGLGEVESYIRQRQDSEIVENYR